MSFFAEMRRRNVVRVGVAYLAASWLLIEALSVVLEVYGAPDWVLQVLIAVLFVGFFIALLFSWAYELTPEGLKKTREVDESESITHSTGARLNKITIAIVLVATGVLLIDRMGLITKLGEPNASTVAAEQARQTNSSVNSAISELSDAPSNSIAVLPFVNMSSDEEQEYFSDGISEELLNVLAKIPDLRVAARTSSFQFKGENRDVQEIAQLLHVNHILEGSVRKAGDQLRITAQLINAVSGFHLWSETYDRKLEDVFAIQDEIAASISNALQSELGLDVPSPSAAPRVIEAANTAAYEAFLRGRYLLNQRGNRAITEAVRELEKAVRLDPNYAPAHAQLATAISMLLDSPQTYGSLTMAQVEARATPHVERAMAINPEIADVWAAKMSLAMHLRRSKQALEFGRRALELNPAYIDVINWMSIVQSDMGEILAAEETMRRLIEVDPLSFVGRLNYVGNVLSYEDQAAARRMADEILEEFPWAGYTAHSGIAFVAGDLTESSRWALLAYGEDPLDRFTNQYLAIGFGALGLVDEAKRISSATRSMGALSAGRFDDARTVAAEDAALDPYNLLHRTIQGTAAYFVRDFEDAAINLEAGVLPESGLVAFWVGEYSRDTARFAHALRATGREPEAGEVIDRIEARQAAVEESARRADPGTDLDRALLHMLLGEHEPALDALERYVASGAYVRHSITEPIFDPIADDPRLDMIVAAYAANLADERKRTLTLICENNPIPDAWQPLPETCAGR
jgi:TolB-like protein